MISNILPSEVNTPLSNQMVLSVHHPIPAPEKNNIIYILFIGNRINDLTICMCTCITNVHTHEEHLVIYIYNPEGSFAL